MMEIRKGMINEYKLNTRIKLLGLWVSLMLLYIYADIFSFYRPSYLNEVIAGFMGPLKVNQMTLVTSGIMMCIPVIVIIATMFSKAKVVRWVNILIGILYLIISLGNIVGETWIYYLMYGIIEIVILLSIVFISYRWSKE